MNLLLDIEIMYPYNRRDHSSRRSSANWNFENIEEYNSNLPDIELSDDSLPEFDSDSDSDSSSSFLSFSSSSSPVCLKPLHKLLLFSFSLHSLWDSIIRQ